ncbi:MAG: hypothetical protein EKK41_05070 [Hyphomicrobiales bacterium]|nr:MAG: hypothetical protein EKK41_05070 [Hyphomicrobiales bacterium]
MIFTLIRDILSNFLLGLTALIVLVLAQINPIAKNNPDSTKPPGDLMVCISWAGNNDVDLWGTAPGQKIATGYANKNGEVLDLVRDDLGKDALSRPRLECQFARGLPDGRWVFNLHGFSINDPEVAVHVEIRLGDAFGYHLLLERDLTIKHKQERTIAQFQLRDGKVVPGSVNEVFVPLRSAQ